MHPIDKRGWVAEERALKARWPACPHGVVGALNQHGKPICVQCLADEAINHPERFTPDQRLARLEGARAAIVSAAHPENRTEGEERARRLNLLASESARAMDDKRHLLAGKGPRR